MAAAWSDTLAAMNAGRRLGRYWADQEDWRPVVTSSHPDVKPTAFLVQPANTTGTTGVASAGQVIIAVASWGETNASFDLDLDAAAIATKIKV